MPDQKNQTIVAQDELDSILDGADSALAVGSDEFDSVMGGADAALNADEELDSLAPGEEAPPQVAVGVPIPEGPVNEQDAGIREKLRYNRVKQISEDLKMVDDKLAAGDQDPNLGPYRQRLVADAKAMYETTQRDIDALKGGVVGWVSRLSESARAQFLDSMLGQVAQLGDIVSGKSVLVPIAPGLGAVPVNPLAVAKATGAVGPAAKSIPLPFIPLPDTMAVGAKEKIKAGEQRSAELERLKPTAFVEKLIWDALESSPSLGAAMVSTLAAGPVGGFLTTFTMEGGSAYSDAIRKGEDDDTALTTSLGVGLVNGALEQIGATQVLNAIGKPALAKAVEAAVKKNVLKRTAEAMTAEGATEFAQELTNIVSERLYQGERPETFKDDLYRALYSGLVGMVMGGAATVTGAGVNKAMDRLYSALNPPASQTQTKRNSDGTATVTSAPVKPVEVTVVDPQKKLAADMEEAKQIDEAVTLSKYLVSNITPAGTEMALLPEKAGETVSGMRTEVTPATEATSAEARVTMQPVSTEINAPEPKLGQRGSIVAEGVYEQGKPKSSVPGQKIKGLADKINVVTGQFAYPEEGPARDRALVGEMLQRADRFLKTAYGIDIPTKDVERQNRIVEIMQKSGDPTANSAALAGEFLGEGILDIASSVEIPDAARTAAVSDLFAILDDFRRTTGQEITPAQFQTDAAAKLAVNGFLGSAMIKWANEGNQAGFAPETVSVIRRFAKWVQSKYEAIRSRGYHVSPELENVFKKVFGYNRSLETNVNAEGSKVTRVSLNYNEAYIDHLGTDTNLWVRQSQDKENGKRTLLIQISSRLINAGMEADLSTTYYDKLYRNRPGYDRTADFWEIPFWMAQVGTVDQQSDIYVVRNMDEAKRFLQSAKYARIAFSALDVNAPMIRDLLPFSGGSKVTIGGYVKNLREQFGVFDNVQTVDTVEEFAKSIGVTWSPDYSYRHFKGTNVIPRLTMSKGCKYACAFCTVPKKVTVLPKADIDKQVESLKDLKSRLVYLDDKTFGQAENYQYLSQIYQRVKEANPDFEGFIVQTTAPDVLRMPVEWLAESGIRYVEIGVESYNDDILKKTRKVSRERTIQEAADKLRNAGISLIPNIIIGLRGVNPDGSTWEETAQTYQKTIDFVERNADIISHLNVYNLALYEGTELGNQVEAKISDSQNNENILSPELYKNPRVHQEASDALMHLGLRLLDKEPTFLEAPVETPGPNVTDYPTMRDAAPTPEHVAVDIVSVDQMRYVLSETGTDPGAMSDAQVKAEFGKLPAILQKEVDAQGIVKAKGVIAPVSAEELEAVTKAGGVNPQRTVLGNQPAVQWDDPLTGSTHYIFGQETVSYESVAQKMADSRAKDWPITSMLRDAGMTPEEVGRTTVGKAREFLKWRRPRGYAAVMADIQARIDAVVQENLLDVTGVPFAALNAVLEPVMIEATANTYVLLQKGKLTIDQFRAEVKRQIHDFAAAHPFLSKYIKKIDAWLEKVKPDLPKHEYTFWHYSNEPRTVLSKDKAGTGQAGEERGRKVIHFYDSPNYRERRFDGKPKHKVVLRAALLNLNGKAGDLVKQAVRDRNHGAMNIDQLITEIKRQGYDGFFDSALGNHTVQYWGENVYPVTINDKANSAYVENMIATREHAARINDLVARYPFGVTIDPRTGERVDSKKLGKRHAFVGMGRDLATYISVDNEGQIKSAGVEKAIQSLMKKHAKLFAGNPHFYVGTWWSELDKALVVDLVRRSDIQQGILAGEWLDQKTVGVLPAIERLSKMEQADPEYAQVLAEAFPPTYGRDRKSNIVDLPTDPVQRWDAVVEKTKNNVVNISALKRPGLTDADKLSNIRAAMSMMAQVTGMGENVPVGAKIRRVRNTLMKEFPTMLDDLVTGMDWYSKDIEKMMETVKKYYPDMDATTKSLFSSMLAITSTQASPEINFLFAMNAMDWFTEKGKLPGPNDFLEFQERYGRIVDEVVENADGEMVKTGNKVKTSGLMKPSEQLAAFDMINRLAKDLGGYDKAVRWMNEKHSYEEVLSRGKAEEVFKYFGEDQPLHGAFILGPKRGAFYLNIEGNRDVFTMDTWGMRLMNFILGDLVNTKRDGTHEVRNTISNAERGDFTRAMTEISKDLGLSVSEFQAVTWYYIQKLWREFGGQTTGGGTFSEAARKWDRDQSNFEPELGFGETGAGAPEAGTPTQQGTGGPGATQASPEGGALYSVIIPGLPQLLKLVEIGIKAAQNPRVVDPKIREDLKRFAAKNNMPPPPETLRPRDIDRYVHQYISNDIKKKMGFEMSMSLIPGVTPAMMEAFSEKIGDMLAVPERMGAARSGAKRMGYNLMRATAIAQVNPKFAKVYRAITETDGQIKQDSNAVLDLVGQAFKDLSASEAQHVAEAVYTGNERQESYTDIELATGVQSAVGADVLPPMTQREIDAYRAVRRAQDAILDIRKNTILFAKRAEMYQFQQEQALLQPGTKPYADKEKDIRDLENDIRNVENYYQTLKDQGYVTLKRSGPIAVFAEDPTKPVGDPDRLVYDHVENRVQEHQLKRRYEAAGYTNVQSYLVQRIPYNVAARLSPAEFDDVLQRAGINPGGQLSDDLKKVRDKIGQRYASSSYALPRKYVRGYQRTADNLKKSMIGQLDAYGTGAFRTIARVKAKDALVQSGMRETDRELSDFSEQYIEDEVSPPQKSSVARWSSRARRATYIMQLAGDVGQLFLNAFAQPVSVTYPYFARKEFNMKGADAEKYFVRGTKLSAQSLKGNGPQEFLGMVKRGKTEDILGSELTQAVIQQEEGKTGKFMHYMSIFSRLGEAVTRRHAFAEAYLVGKEKMNLKGEELYQFMKMAVSATQGRWSSGENPGLVRKFGEPGRALYQFQSFQQIWAENLVLAARDARKNGGVPGAFLRQLASSVALAGVTGLPFAGLAQLILAALTGDDPDKWAKKNLSSSKELNDVVLYGLSGHPGISVRMGVLSNVPDFGTRGVTEALNPLRFMPAVSTAESMVTGIEDIAAGQYARGAEGLLPRAIRGPVRAARYYREGVKDRKGKIIVPRSKLSAADIALQAVNVTPPEVTKYYRNQRIGAGPKKGPK